MLSIDNDVAQVIDVATGMSFDIALSAPGGVLPIPGDQWVCSREASGFWAFERCVSMRNAQPQTSFRDSMQVLIDRGLLNPSYADGTNEGYHLAYIGEIRYFPFLVPPNDRWIPANGAFVNRVQYRELAHVFDPLGTSTTFQVPYVADPGIANSSAWINMPYTSPWADYTTPLVYAPGQYRRVADRIEFQGLITSATANSGQTMFTLPSGFLPPYANICICMMNNLYGRVDINPNGTVTLGAVATGVAVPGSVWVSFTGISVYSPVPTSTVTVKPYICARK